MILASVADDWVDDPNRIQKNKVKIANIHIKLWELKANRWMMEETHDMKEGYSILMDAPEGVQRSRDKTIFRDFTIKIADIS